MIVRINQSKILTKNISCECKYKYDGRKCNSNQKRNNSKCGYECKNPGKHYMCEKNDIWNSSTCSCENDKHLETIIGDEFIKL